jgi:hypothetical protein
VPPEQSGNAAPLDTSPPRGGQFSVTRAARAVAPPAGVHAAKASSAAGTLAALNDGKGRVTLERDGVVAGLPSLTPGLQRAVGLALRTQQAPTPALLRDLTGTAATLLGRAEAEDTFAVTAPVGTVVRSTRPTFDWHPLNGASSYIVTVLDADFNPVATSPRLTATSWTVPEPLRRGVVYRWQVTALKNGERVISPSALAPEARFKVLDDAATNELERAEQTCLGSHLACGVLYSGAGLLDDAEREFKALLDANPHSALAQELLSSVRKPRRPR